MSKQKRSNMDNLGHIIRKLREEKALPLRTVAGFLDIDQAILSKIERGQRKATRPQVLKLAEYFKAGVNDLLIAWLADKVVYHLEDEDIALKVLQVAEERIAYKSTKSLGLIDDKRKIISQIQGYFQSQDLVTRVWLFGSFARHEDTYNDIDILIDLPAERKFTLFDIAEIKDQLQSILKKTIDVVMLNGIRPEVKDRIKNDMQLIYEA